MTPAKSKVVILLTDGVNNTGKISPLAAAEAARALGVKIYTIGVGVRGKAPIPVKDEAGNMHLIMAEVDVDEKTLQAVADETGGKFYRATDTDSLQKIYEEINRFEKSAQTVQKFEHVEELYPWALIPALAHSWIELCSCSKLDCGDCREIQPALGGCRRDCCRVPRAHLDVAPLRCAPTRRAGQVRLGAPAASIDAVDIARRGAACSAGLFLAALICLFVALAGPLVGYRWEQVSRRGNEIMFAIDTSRSMLTPDVKPNRLTRAKLAIDDFAKQLGWRRRGHRGICGHAPFWRARSRSTMARFTSP